MIIMRCEYKFPQMVTGEIMKRITVGGKVG